MLVSGVTVRELSRFIARSGNVALADNGSFYTAKITSWRIPA